MGRLDEGKASTGRTDYGTPDYVMRKIVAMFGPIDLDVAASDDLHVCDRYLTDCTGPWPSSRQAYMNPPYGKEIGQFLARARVAVLAGEAACVICLVPARTSTQWWYDSVVCPSVPTAVYFVQGKIAFVGQEHQAMFPSVMIVYGHPIKDSAQMQYIDAAMVDFRKKSLRGV